MIQLVSASLSGYIEASAHVCYTAIQEDHGEKESFPNVQFIDGAPKLLVPIQEMVRAEPERKTVFHPSFC